MAYRVTLECGDKSSLKSQKTPEGYTHDWEVYIRGADDAPIHHYVEKVVFNLHETFQKPKRVIREPPYVVKESGYGGFHIPIHVYLKNKAEPKKFEILYNLNLEPSIPHVSHHNEIVVNPTDEFRKKLLKGGATPISSAESVPEKSVVKTVPMVGKPKLSGIEQKKHRPPEPKTSGDRTFTDIFGESIKTPKVTLEKKVPEKTSSAKTVPTPEKGDKTDKSTKTKHSPLKDGKKEKSSEERKEKRDKEKEKFKDKSKRASSPGVPKVSHQSSENKRSSSPPLAKKPKTPPPVPNRLSSPSSKPKEKEIKKTDSEREKEKEKVKESSKSDEVKAEKSEKESKSERKKEKKKHKEDRDKEKKEKHKEKEREKSRDKEGVKSSEKKVENPEKVEKEKIPEPKHQKEEKKSPKPVKEVEKVKEEKIPKPEKAEKSEKSEKHKESKSEKSEKSKHKHKKKDKKERRDESREREKKEKKEKIKISSEKINEVSNHSTTVAPAAIRTSDIIDRDSSDSAASGDEDMVKSKTPIPIKKETPSPLPPAEIPRTMSPPPPPVNDVKKEKEKKRDKSKSSREDKEKKKKRKSESKGLDDDISVKKPKTERDHSSSPLVEPVSSSQSPIAAANLDTVHSKIKHDPDDSSLTNEQATSGDSEQVAPDSTNSTLVDTEEPLVFSEDYVTQLKELQQKIMTLQDNQELQRVVQVIAETGQYEITKKTFDFDLCALDRATVQRLQQFFAS